MNEIHFIFLVSFILPLEEKQHKKILFSFITNTYTRYPFPFAAEDSTFCMFTIIS